MYLQVMREQDPALFKELCRAGKLDQFANQKCREAEELLHQVLGAEPRQANGDAVNPNAQASAEEIVRSIMLDFPQKPDPSRAEPPDDLPRRASQIR